MNRPVPTIVQEVDRSFGLDVCRTIAILLVVSGHMLQHSQPFRPLAEMGFLGLFGVDLFFCLSGFLIGRILLAESAKWPVDHEAGLFRFWYRRWMRTLPLYFFYLLVSLKYDWRGETTLQANVQYLIFAQNIAWPMPDFFHLSWSLAVEEWFYLLFPLVLLLFVGLGVSARRAALCAIGVLIGVPFLMRWMLPAQMPELKNLDEGLRHVVAFRLDAIGFGVLMAFLYVSRRAWFDRVATYWPIAVVGVVSVCLSTKFQYFGWTSAALLAPIYFTMSAFFFALLVPKFNSLRPTRFRYLNRFVKFTSLISYSLYLGHIPGFMVAIWLLHRVHAFDTVYPIAWLTYPLFVALAYLISTLTYFAIERPVLNLRDRKTRSAFHPRAAALRTS